MREGKDINVGEVRKRYQPLRERTENLLRESGIKQGPEYRKARKNLQEKHIWQE